MAEETNPEVLKLIEEEKPTISNLNKVNLIDQITDRFRNMFMEEGGFAIKTTCGRLISFINRIIASIDKNPNFAVIYKERIIERIRDEYHDTELAEKLSNVYFAGHGGVLEKIKADVEGWGAQGANLDYYIKLVQEHAQNIKKYFGEKAYGLLLKRGIIKHLDRYYDEARYLEGLLRMIEAGEKQKDWRSFMEFHEKIKEHIKHVRDHFGDEVVAEEMKEWEKKYHEDPEDWKKEMKGAVISTRDNLQSSEYAGKVIAEAQREFLDAISDIEKLVSKKGKNAERKFMSILKGRKRHWNKRVYFERERFKQYESSFLLYLIRGEEKIRGLKTTVEEGINSNAGKIAKVLPLINKRHEWFKWIHEVSEIAADKIRKPTGQVIRQIQDGMDKAKTAIAGIAEQARPILEEIEKTDTIVEKSNTKIIDFGKRSSEKAVKEGEDLFRVMREISAEFGIDLRKIIAEAEMEKPKVEEMPPAREMPLAA